MNNWIITIIAQPEPMLLARITVLLRKYGVEIRSIERTLPRPDGTEMIYLTVRNARDNMTVAMSKLERLVPIIQLEYAVKG